MDGGLDELRDAALGHEIGRVDVVVGASVSVLRSRLWRAVQARNGVREVSRGSGSGATGVGAGDAELAAAWCRGDAEALDVLLGRHLDKLVGYARRHVGNAAAEDVVHDAMIELIEGPEKLRSERAVVPQLFGFVRNVALRLMRDRARRSNQTLEADVPEGAPRFDDLIADRDLLATALARCELLDQDYVLGAMGGLSSAELAERCGVTVKAARVRLHRARKRLVAALERLR